MTASSQHQRQQLERGRANVAHLRAQYEHDMRMKAEREDDMTQINPTGIKRVKLKTTDAKGAVGALNQKLDAALDEVRVAFQREAQAAEAEGLERGEDARRAPALNNPRAVR